MDLEYWYYFTTSLLIVEFFRQRLNLHGIVLKFKILILWDLWFIPSLHRCFRIKNKVRILMWKNLIKWWQGQVFWGVQVRQHTITHLKWSSGVRFTAHLNLGKSCTVKYILTAHLNILRSAFCSTAFIFKRQGLDDPHMIVTTKE